MPGRRWPRRSGSAIRSATTRAVRTLQRFDGVVEQATEDELAEAAARADLTGHVQRPAHRRGAGGAGEAGPREARFSTGQRTVVISTANGLKFTDFKVALPRARRWASWASPRAHANQPVELPADFDAVRRAVFALDSHSYARPGQLARRRATRPRWREPGLGSGARRRARAHRCLRRDGRSRRSHTPGGHPQDHLVFAVGAVDRHPERFLRLVRSKRRAPPGSGALSRSGCAGAIAACGKLYSVFTHLNRTLGVPSG